jgi:negative regulator of replication initiation
MEERSSKKPPGKSASYILREVIAFKQSQGKPAKKAPKKAKKKKQ